jgi:hypothetical protein
MVTGDEMRFRPALASYDVEEVKAQAPGKWIAVDRDTNEPRHYADSRWELSEAIRQLQLRNVLVIQAPPAPTTIDLRDDP